MQARQQVGQILKSRASAGALTRSYSVTSYIWDRDRITNSVGHAALKVDHVNDSGEKEEHYISHWPDGGATKPGIKWKSYPGRFIDSLERDKIANGTIGREGLIPKEPSATVVLNSLNERAMVEEYKKLKEGLNWSLIARDGSHSCASLSSHLLSVGGMDKTLAAGTPEDKRKVGELNFVDNIATPKSVRIISETAKKIENSNPKLTSKADEGEKASRIEENDATSRVSPKFRP